MSLYSLYWSDVRLAFTLSGVREGIDGLIASWPSCALLLDLKILALAEETFHRKNFYVFGYLFNCNIWNSEWVCSHISDKTGCTHTFDINAFVEFLSNLHCSSRLETEFSRCFLLKSWCYKRRCRRFLSCTVLNLCNYILGIWRSASILSACSPLVILILPFSSEYKDAEKDFLLPFGMNFASIDQYSSGLNFLISSSLSTIILTATDWTRPAERPLLISEK